MTGPANAATRAGRMMKAAALASAAWLSLCVTAARAGDLSEYDIVTPYLQRTDSITAGAGNSKAVNSVTHMLDPWPAYAGDRRIPHSGERMSGAVERYRDVSKQSQTPATLAPASGQTGSSGNSATSSSTANSTAASPSAGR